MVRALEEIPLYEKVADNVGKLIATGVLRPGDRVPSVRQTSRQQGVSLSTSVQAYLRLENRGLIEARPRSGYYVRFQSWTSLEPSIPQRPATATRVKVSNMLGKVMDAAADPAIVPFGAACPDPALLPAAKLTRLMARVTREAGIRGLQYDMPPGSIALRRQLAKRSISWQCPMSPDDFIVTNGAAEALCLCLRATTKPGDTVAIEAPIWFGIFQLVEDLGLRAVGIPLHPKTGMDLEALESILKRNRISAVVSIPNYNNPMGSLMPEANKKRLIEILARREIPLIEDDLYGDLPFEGPRPSIAKRYDTKGLVLLCGSVSKTLAPGYRVGWSAPGRYYDKVRALKMTSSVGNATLPSLAIAEFLNNGGYDHHLRSIRRAFREAVQRISAGIAETFPKQTRISRPQGGFVIWVQLPGKRDAMELYHRALAQQIGIAPGPMFSPGKGFPNCFRINCAHVWTPRIEKAVATLGHLARQLI